MTSAPLELPQATASRAQLGRDFDFFPYLLIAPIALLLLAISFYPAVYAVYLAMTDASMLRLSRMQFTGLANFYRLAADPIFLQGLWKTLRWDLAVVLLELAIALPLALFLNLNFKGRGFVRAAVVIPYIIPPAVAALMWVYIFDGNFGVANDLLVRAGIFEKYYSWLSEPTASFWIVVVAMVWSGTPLMAIILLAAMQAIPGEFYEAARVDGANAWQRFWHITLPQIMPTVLFICLLRTIWMSNHIDMIFIMTRGGPGFANYTEAVYSFMVTTRFEIGYSSAIAVVLAIILMTASAFYVRHLARSVLA
jgi:multiple sugar transport system permease protein